MNKHSEKKIFLKKTQSNLNSFLRPYYLYFAKFSKKKVKNPLAFYVLTAQKPNGLKA